MTAFPDWIDAERALRRALAAWIDASVARQETIPYHGIHDEGSFTFSWDAYLFLTGDARVRRFLARLRDGFSAWADREFVHGYYPEGEVHHATEPFTHFVARFRTLDPGDATAPRLIDDAAHHVGNWEPGVPPWYDWAAHAMVSWRLGSRVVPAGPPSDYEEPDSTRPAQIALAAWAMTGDRRYLDFCVDYADKWTAALLAEPLPVAAFYRSPPSSYADGLIERAAGDAISRVELIAASGMVDWLLDLFRVTGFDRYRAAVARVAETLAGCVADPRNAISGGLLAKYRRITGDTAFDDAAVERIATAEERAIRGDPAILETRDVAEERKRGMLSNRRIGHRYDQVRWGRSASGETREATEPTPAALSLAWLVAGDDRYAALAMDRAAERVRLGAMRLDDGRDHGCAGFTLGAVASGHGRADRFGDVNTVLGPLALGSVRLFSAEEPLVVYPGGLPEEIATLVRLTGSPSVRWVNRGAERVVFEWRDASEPDGAIHRIDLPPGAEREERLAGVAPLPAFASVRGEYRK